MNLMLRGVYCLQSNLSVRCLSVTSVQNIKQWREERGLPVNKNAEGILIDGPDFTYLDGRPTPLLHKQKKRMLQNQQYTEKIVTICSELDFAKQRHQDLLEAEEQKRDNVRRNWLKPKGNELYKK